MALALSIAACQTDASSQEIPATLASAPAVAAPALAAIPAPVFASPDSLIGLNETEILDFFGPPSLKRKETPAELWQYSGNGCIMDLYLYSESGSKTVSYVTLRDPSTGRVGGTACQNRMTGLSRR